MKVFSISYIALIQIKLMFHIVLTDYVILQGTSIIENTKYLSDPILIELAAGLPLRCIGAKAPSTTERYSKGFEKFKLWASKFKDLRAIPTDSLTVCLYLEYLIRSGGVYSALESAYYGIRWAHNMYNLPNPCEGTMVSNILESAKRMLAKPVNKKEPITPEMMLSICKIYANQFSSLAQLRTAAICVTAYAGFLRYNELAGIRCCDVKLCLDSHVELNVAKSKTDVYRLGSKVLLAKTDLPTCPFNILSRYIREFNIELTSEQAFFRKLHVSSKGKYSLRGEGLTYSCARSVVLEAISKIGYPTDKFGLHSFRSGGATAAANAGVNDRLFKRHGRWKSETAKDGYVKDNVEALLSVSKRLFKNQ